MRVRHGRATVSSERAGVALSMLTRFVNGERLSGRRALRDGVAAFEPGLLARAIRGFLYIDEANRFNPVPHLGLDRRDELDGESLFRGARVAARGGDPRRAAAPASTGRAKPLRR